MAIKRRQFSVFWIFFRQIQVWVKAYATQVSDFTPWLAYSSMALIRHNHVQLFFWIYNFPKKNGKKPPTGNLAIAKGRV
jgi:hypothetical protein